MVKYCLSFLILFFFRTTIAQETILDQYIKQGLESNLALKQQMFSLEQSLEALNEARGLYFPSLELGARFTRAGGGREIIIPVGDLVNPIYKTLNQLLASQGQPPLFPEDIPNQSVPFLREKEQETRLRLVQPIFQPAIWNNYSLTSDLSSIERRRTEIFKRELIMEIKYAYYTYLKAEKVVDLYQKIIELQRENLRVSDKLFQAGKATQNVVFRAKAELSRTEQENIKIENLKRQSQSYFNFILNRPLEAEIQNEETNIMPEPGLNNLETAINQALAGREEIEQVKMAITASDHNAAIIRSRYFPGVNAVIDYGFQGTEYRFSDKDDYWMASLVFEWNLFRGFQDKAKLQKAKLESEKLFTKQEEIKKRITLEVERIYDNLRVVRKSIDVAEEQVESARLSFKIVQKKYEEGIASQIEYLDAQTTLSDAAINSILTRYDFYITYAEYDRIVASDVL
jgi:outer membrane protein TolC